MTQTSHLKSLAITNLDAIPPLAPTTGEGGPGFLREVSGFATPLAADAAGSTYQLVRVPSNAKIKSLVFFSEAQGAGKVDLSVYYSDSTVDGTQVSLQGLVVPTTGASFFSGDIDCSSAVAPTEKAFANETNSGSYVYAAINEPLWQALGLASDPGGFFDIVAVVHTTAVTTGTGVLGVSARYVV